MKKLHHAITKIIKASLFVFLSLTVLLSDVSRAEKLKVVTTFTIIADITRNITGDLAIVESITKPGAEIHNYQPTPRDIIKAQDADIIIHNGMGLELWFEQFYDNLEDVPSILATKNIKPIGISTGPYDGKPNPHAWMALESARAYVKNITDGLSHYDEGNRKEYEKNAKIYISKIENTLLPLTEKIDEVNKKERWLVTSEGAFSYLARDLKLNELYIWPINADQQGSPKQVKEVIDSINENGIKVIFSESTISPKPAQQIARETKIRYGGVLYVDSLTDENGPVPTYIDLLNTTYSTVISGLTAQ